MIYIFELDGVLCEESGRRYGPSLPFISLFNMLSDYKHFRYRIFTKRSDKYYRHTVEWLYAFTPLRQIDESVLKMRREGDQRASYMLKQEWLGEVIRREPEYASNITAFDTCGWCIKMYIDSGVNCLQVRKDLIS